MIPKDFEGLVIEFEKVTDEYAKLKEAHENLEKEYKALKQANSGLKKENDALSKTISLKDQELIDAKERSKENCASFFRLLPRSKPVAMVEPLRESPGSTAHACAIPIIKACSGEIFSFSFGW